jgi:hypothetical protein
MAGGPAAGRPVRGVRESLIRAGVSFCAKLQRRRLRSSVAPDRHGSWKRSPLDAAGQVCLRLVQRCSAIQSSGSALGRLPLAQALTLTKDPARRRGAPDAPRRELNEDQHGQAPDAASAWVAALPHCPLEDEHPGNGAAS